MSDQLRELMERINREESIAYGKISTLLSHADHVAVMRALDPLSEAISEALQLDFDDRAALHVTDTPAPACSGEDVCEAHGELLFDGRCEDYDRGRRDKIESLAAEVLAKAWANVMDGRLIETGPSGARLSNLVKADDWQAIAAEYARLTEADHE